MNANDVNKYLSADYNGGGVLTPSTYTVNSKDK